MKALEKYTQRVAAVEKRLTEAVFRGDDILNLSVSYKRAKIRANMDAIMARVSDDLQKFEPQAHEDRVRRLAAKRLRLMENLERFEGQTIAQVIEWYQDAGEPCPEWLVLYQERAANEP